MPLYSTITATIELAVWGPREYVFCFLHITAKPELSQVHAGQKWMHTSLPCFHRHIEDLTFINNNCLMPYTNGCSVCCLQYVALWYGHGFKPCSKWQIYFQPCYPELFNCSFIRIHNVILGETRDCLGETQSKLGKMNFPKYSTICIMNSSTTNKPYLAMNIYITLQHPLCR